MPKGHSRIDPPLKWHGGKFYLAPHIVNLMPSHKHYVEPYAGGLSVLLSKNPEGISEVVNDLNEDLTNFWKVLQSEDTFGRFQRALQAVPFSEAEWDNAAEISVGEPIERAIRFFIRCRQSLAGRMDRFAPLSKTRTRRDMNEQASAWVTAVDGLPTVYARLRRVAILNRDALSVIKEQDSPGTLFYLDPPYLSETRTSEAVYAHEMTVAQHEQLLNSVLSCHGKVMLSGYHSELYDRKLRRWKRHEFEIKNQAAQARKKRVMTEVLWCNFP
ncbi:DNA adenine methylase [Gemmata sp.]|uniref:DNA adenine methylase n=1 Tax=Gemmata sp. TaxID=1914242 RepID=UPI003F6EDCDE